MTDNTNARHKAASSVLKESTLTENLGPEIAPQQVQGTTRKASSSGNVEYSEPVILSETSKSKVIALPWYIPHSDRTRLSLKIQTLRKADPPNSWIEVEEKSITLREDATEKLVAELPKFAAVAHQESTGDYLIVKLGPYHLATPAWHLI